MLILQLMDAIRRGGDQAEEAALALGLLIERERTNRPLGDDGGVQLILGEQMAKQRFSEVELKSAVHELIRYVNETPNPHPSAVWALTKSYDGRIVTPLIELLKRLLPDPSQENAACAALSGIMNTGISSELQRESLAIIRQAAEVGFGRVKEAAIAYTNTFFGLDEAGRADSD